MHTTKNYALLTCLILLLSSSGLSAEAPFWPGWLGPNRDGWVKDVIPPKVWPEKLTQVWKIEVGTGYGTPLVQGDLVFTHTRQGEQEVMQCVDLKTGQTKWRQGFDMPFKIGGGGEYHGKGPKSNPILADGRIFSLSISGVLAAWDAKSGKQLWVRDYSEQFEKGHPYWGASTSPIVSGSRVMVHFGNDEVGALVAMDAKSGRELWRSGKDGTAYASPLLADFGGVHQIVQWNHEALVGVAVKTGVELWRFPLPHLTHNQNMPTPAVHDGHVIVGGENRGMYSLQPVVNGGKWSVKERWFQPKAALDMSSAIVSGDRIYGMTHYNAGQLFCLDTKTGEFVWQGPPRSANNVTFLAMPGYVAALINNGHLKILRSGTEQYDEVRSYKVAEDATWAAPVFLQGKILIKDVNTLTLWTY
ncbi:MAG: PQQ-like beta-propeller repeat protein [Pirellulales bacterium]|nr:PQQ-like beta-propeller repeat protein [Pirellulales bacterium]